MEVTDKVNIDRSIYRYNASIGTKSLSRAKPFTLPKRPRNGERLGLTRLRHALTSAGHHEPTARAPVCRMMPPTGPQAESARGRVEKTRFFT